MAETSRAGHADVVDIKKEPQTSDIKKEPQTSSDEEEEDKQEGLSHVDVITKFKHGLAKLIKNDPLLCDLPQEITLEEVNSQIALEYGQAMTVYVHRGDGNILSVVVVQNSTVLDLKKAIRRHLMLKQSREGSGTHHISWPYIWRTYWLDAEGQKLTQDNRKLKEYGIRNRTEVTFVKKRRSLGVERSCNENLLRCM